MRRALVVTVSLTFAVPAALAELRGDEAMLRPAGRDSATLTRQTPAAGGAVGRDSVEGDAVALAEGAKLFVAYNCMDCHGADGSGAMGPSLQDNRWRFGGSADEIYLSIADGRPEGMPAWRPMIPADHIVKLVTYLRTLGAGKDVSTENFTGVGVERSGH